MKVEEILQKENKDQKNKKAQNDEFFGLLSSTDKKEDKKLPLKKPDPNILDFDVSDNEDFLNREVKFLKMDKSQLGDDLSDNKPEQDPNRFKSKNIFPKEVPKDNNLKMFEDSENDEFLDSESGTGRDQIEENKNDYQKEVNHPKFLEEEHQPNFLGQDHTQHVEEDEFGERFKRRDKEADPEKKDKIDDEQPQNFDFSQPKELAHEYKKESPVEEEKGFGFNELKAHPYEEPRGIGFEDPKGFDYRNSDKHRDNSPEEDKEDEPLNFMKKYQLDESSDHMEDKNSPVDMRKKDDDIIFGKERSDGSSNDSDNSGDDYLKTESNVRDKSPEFLKYGNEDSYVPPKSGMGIADDESYPGEFSHRSKEKSSQIESSIKIPLEQVNEFDSPLKDINKESSDESLQIKRKNEQPGEYKPINNWNHKVKKNAIKNKKPSQLSMQKKQSSLLDEFKIDMKSNSIQFDEKDYLQDPDFRKIIEVENTRKLNELLDDDKDADLNELEILWKDTEAVKENPGNIFQNEREILVRFFNNNPEGILKLKDYYDKRNNKIRKLEEMEDKESYKQEIEIEKIERKSLLK